RLYYPDETVATWSKPVAEPPVRMAPDALALNFHYEVKKDRQFPWLPDQVFDDGTRVYIKLPQDARSTVAPVLFVLEGDGARTLVTYSSVGGDTYVTDRLFVGAERLAGIAAKERRARIERREGGGK